MAFKSEAQRRKLAELVKKGKLPQKVYDAFEQETGKKKLPERIGPKKGETPWFPGRFGVKK